MTEIIYFLWHAQTGEYCPERGSGNGVVRFGKVDKAYKRRVGGKVAKSCSRRTTNIVSVVERLLADHYYCSAESLIQLLTKSGILFCIP